MIFAINDSITSNVANLQTSINGKSTVWFFKPTIGLANGNTMTRTAGDAYGLRFDMGRALIAFEVAVKCTTARAAGDSILCFMLDNAFITLGEPYGFACFLNGETYARLSSKSSDGRYIANPIAWNANTEFRVTGAFIAFI